MKIDERKRMKWNKWMNEIEWMIEWTNEWMNERTNEWMNEWMNKRTNEWMNEPMNEWMNEWTNEWMNEWMNEWINEWMNEPMNEIEWTNQWMKLNEQTNEWNWMKWNEMKGKLWNEINEWMKGNERINEWKKERKKERMKNEWRNEGMMPLAWWWFCWPHLARVLQTPQFLHIFKWKSSSRYSPVQFLSTTSPQSSRATGETETLLRFQATLPEKTQGFAPGSVFEPDFTRSRSLTLPNYLMMMRLPWWCGWHYNWDDGVVAMMVRKLAMTIVRNSEVS